MQRNNLKILLVILLLTPTMLAQSESSGTVHTAFPSEIIAVLLCGFLLWLVVNLLKQPSRRFDNHDNILQALKNTLSEHNLRFLSINQEKMPGHLSKRYLEIENLLSACRLLVASIETGKGSGISSEFINNSVNELESKSDRIRDRIQELGDLLERFSNAVITYNEKLGVIDNLIHRCQELTSSISAQSVNFQIENFSSELTRATEKFSENPERGAEMVARLAGNLESVYADQIKSGEILVDLKDKLGKYKLFLNTKLKTRLANASRRISALSEITNPETFANETSTILEFPEKFADSLVQLEITLAYPFDQHAAKKAHDVSYKLISEFQKNFTNLGKKLKSQAKAKEILESDELNVEINSYIKNDNISPDLKANISVTQTEIATKKIANHCERLRKLDDYLNVAEKQIKGRRATRSKTYQFPDDVTESDIKLKRVQKNRLSSRKNHAVSESSVNFEPNFQEFGGSRFKVELLKK